MSEQGDAGGLINVPRLEAWLDANISDLGEGPLVYETLTGGASNEVFKINRGGEWVVLRRPPAVKRHDSDKILVREARVLKALNQTDVPHPHCYGLCEDDAVIGAHFYVMEMVDGWAPLGLTEYPAPFDKPGEEKRNLAFELVDAMARLANVDYKAVGLEGFGKPDGFLERQVDRWFGQLESYKRTDGYAGRDIPGIDYVGDWLRANTPEMSPAGLIHGDYGFANVMFGHGAPARVAAMIDWELSTVGDPLLDVGWVLYGFRSEGEKTAPSGYMDPSDYPTREALAQFYAERTGRNVDNLRYYMILAQFKLASLLEGHYARYLAGRQSKEKGEAMGVMVPRLIEKAKAMAEGVA